MSKSAWETYSGDSLAGLNLWETGKAGRPGYMTAQGEVPVTYSFKTREGGIGILQILGFVENPLGVKIRYKMVQPPDVQVEGKNSLATEDAESPAPNILVRDKNTENNQNPDVQVEAEDSSINVADKSGEPLDARSQKALKTVREFISAVKAEKYEIANTYLLSESEQADEWPELDAI